MPLRARSCLALQSSLCWQLVNMLAAGLDLCQCIAFLTGRRAFCSGRRRKMFWVLLDWTFGCGAACLLTWSSFLMAAMR